MQAVEAALKAEGLPPLAWYDLLLELKRAGSDGLRPYRLQSEMLIPQYNMSRLIDRVEKAGLVERVACDGRQGSTRADHGGRERNAASDVAGLSGRSGAGVRRTH